MILPFFLFWEEPASIEVHYWHPVLVLDCRLRLEGSRGNSSFLNPSMLRFKLYSFHFESFPFLVQAHQQFSTGPEEDNYVFSQVHPYHQILFSLELRDAR